MALYADVIFYQHLSAGVLGEQFRTTLRIALKLHLLYL